MKYENMKQKIICFDLDDTLCTPNYKGKRSVERYGLDYCLPITENIEYLNSLYTEGHKIIIFTARRMLTHEGNIQKIILDVGQMTKNWLHQHGVQYHELIFGKPYADVYIDDKALNVKDINCEI